MQKVGVVPLLQKDILMVIAPIIDVVKGTVGERCDVGRHEASFSSFRPDRFLETCQVLIGYIFYR
jgi:hypothetical protein